MSQSNKMIANYIIDKLSDAIQKKVNEIYIWDREKKLVGRQYINEMIDAVETLENQFNSENKGLSMEFAYNYIGEYMDSFVPSMAV